MEGQFGIKNSDLEGLLDPHTTIYENQFQERTNQTPLGILVDAV
jgi:hypothetical protein